MWAPESSVENGALVVKAYREVVVLSGLACFCKKKITAYGERYYNNGPYNYFFCFIIHMRWG